MPPEVQECIFYKLTAAGYRCVLMGPEDWKALSERYLQRCKSSGAGCPVLAALEGKLASNSCGFSKGQPNELLYKE
uniref:Uncharacterized protein n=1 Tax=Thermofilum pendens TaxID=2269 RepID=A0A7J3X4X1_THEPE